MKTNDKQIVYYLFLSLHVVMTVVNVVLSYYFWRCGLFYYLSISGFYDDETDEVRRSQSQGSETSQPFEDETGDDSMTNSDEGQMSETSSWLSDTAESEKLSEISASSRISKALSYRSNLSSRASSNFRSSRKSDRCHTEDEMTVKH